MRRRRRRTRDAGDAEGLGAEDGEDEGGHEGGDEDLCDAVLAGGLDEVEGKSDAGEDADARRA